LFFLSVDKTTIVRKNNKHTMVVLSTERNNNKHTMVVLSTERNNNKHTMVVLSTERKNNTTYSKFSFRRNLASMISFSTCLPVSRNFILSFGDHNSGIFSCNPSSLSVGDIYDMATRVQILPYVVVPKSPHQSKSERKKPHVQENFRAAIKLNQLEKKYHALTALYRSGNNTNYRQLTLHQKSWFYGDRDRP
jgi:uncharacterized protein YifN (PemK superfamily)